MIDVVVVVVVVVVGGRGRGEGRRIQNPRNQPIKAQDKTFTKHQTRHIHKTRRRAGGFTYKCDTYMDTVLLPSDLDPFVEDSLS